MVPYLIMKVAKTEGDDCGAHAKQINVKGSEPQGHCSVPSFGSDAAGPACDGAVYVGEVGVIPRVVPCANLQIVNKGKVKNQRLSDSLYLNIMSKLDSGTWIEWITGH